MPTLAELALGLKRNTPAASAPTYTNASLRKLVAPEDTETPVAHWQGDEPEFAGRGNTAASGPRAPYREPSADELLGGARGALDRAELLRRNTLPGAADLAEAERRVREHTPERSPAEKVKGVTDAMKVGGSFGLEAYERAPNIHPALRVAAGLGKWLVPTYLPAVTASGVRQMIAPVNTGSVMGDSEGESRLGGVGEILLGETGNLLHGASSLKAAAQDALAARKTAKTYTAAREAFESGATKGGRPSPTMGPSKLGLGREVPITMAAPTVNPNQVLAVAREVSAETGVPVETVLKGYFKSGGVEAGRKDALLSLFKAGQKDPRRALAAELDDASNLRGKWGGDRTTGSFTEGSGGLTAAAQGKLERYPMPGTRTNAELDDMIRKLIDEGTMPEFEFSGSASDLPLVQEFETGRKPIPSADVLKRLLGL